jgi:hypothetical protein
MPKIPLYNQGQGGAVRTATGALSPRANIGAFTAQGQAQAALMQQAGQVAFQFGQEQKRVEENRIYSESLKEFDQKQFNFITNNKDTDTTVFDKNYGVFADDFLAKIGTRTDINQRQKDRIIQKLMPSVTASKLQGARIVFDRGQQRRTIAANEELESTINKISLIPAGTPERLRLQEDAHKLIATSITDNLRIDYTKESFDRGVKATDYGIRSNNISSVAEAETLRKELDKEADLSFKVREQLKSQINQDETKYRADLLQSGIEFVQASEYTFQEAQAAQEALDQGKPFTFGDKTFDPKDLKPSQRGQLANVLTGESKDLEDLATQNIANSLVESDNPFQASVDLFKAENRAGLPQTDEQLEGTILSVAQDISESVEAAVASGDISSVQNLADNISMARDMINHDYRGQGSLLQRQGTMGNTANSIQQKLARAEKELYKAVNNQNLIKGGQLAMSQNNFVTFANAAGLTDKQKNQVVESTMQSIAGEGLFNDAQINALARNNQTYDLFKETLSLGAANLRNPDVDVATDPYVQSAYELYKRMDLREQLKLNHTNSDVRRVFDSMQVLEKSLGFEGAVDVIRMQRDMSDSDLNIRYKEVQKKVEEVIDDKSLTYSWYDYIPFMGKDAEFVPTNITNIKNDISNLTKEYIRTGLGPDKALEKAATEWGATHERIRNIVVPKTKDLPTNIEELATTAIMHITNTDIPEGAMGGTYASRDAALQAGVIPSADQTLVRYLANNDIDINELSIFPIEGSSQQWMLIDNGLTPLNGEGNKVITFSLDELELIFDADQARQKEEAQQQTNFTIKLENDFALGIGQFEGLTYQQKVTKKEQLEGVPTFTIGPDLPAFFERLKRRLGEEAEEVLAP